MSTAFSQVVQHTVGLFGAGGWRWAIRLTGSQGEHGGLFAATVWVEGGEGDTHACRCCACDKLVLCTLNLASDRVCVLLQPAQEALRGPHLHILHQQVRGEPSLNWVLRAVPAVHPAPTWQHLHAACCMPVVSPPAAHERRPTHLNASACLTPTLNGPQVKAGQDQAFWEDKGWIDKQDPRGWFQW